MKVLLFLPLINGMSCFAWSGESEMCQDGKLLAVFMKVIKSALNRKECIDLDIDDGFEVASSNHGAFVSSLQKVGTKTDPIYLISIQRLSSHHPRR